jgi:hypothetical protein
LKDGETAQRLDYGQHVEVEARVRRPHNYNNPGSFDYAGFLARKDIYWTAAMATGSTARILPGRCGSRFLSVVFALRVAALDRIERLYPDDNYSTGMMEAILIGESSKLERGVDREFPPHRDVSRAGDRGNARERAGRRAVVSAAGVRGRRRSPRWRSRPPRRGYTRWFPDSLHRWGGGGRRGSRCIFSRGSFFVVDEC